MLYRKLIRPVLFLFPPETIHRITFFFFRHFPWLGILTRSSIKKAWEKPGNGAIELLGLRFDHPVGLAAGMDKNVSAMAYFQRAGFAFMEIGTITPRAQVGNPKPRLFRLREDQALINRMGFNNIGIEEAVKSLQHKPPGIIIGGNIGKNTQTANQEAWRDYLTCFSALYDLVDYFVVNVSCPNIKNLSELQDPEALEAILKHLISYRDEQPANRPILLKVSPDLSDDQMDDLIGVIKNNRVDGVVATNTSIQRINLTASAKQIDHIGAGGLSGKPLSTRSTEVISYLNKKLGGDFPIIASGGVMGPQDAYDKLMAGAHLVQVYTGYVYHGPSLIPRILRAIQTS